MADFDPVKLAIVGCGAMSELGHLPSLLGTDALKAAVLIDPDIGRARSLAEKFGVPHYSSDLADAARHAEAACVVVPHHVHAQVACDLLARGLPVLMEKPLAVTLPECDAIIQAAEAAGVVLAVAMVRRFARSTRFLKAALASGLFGRAQSFRLVSGVAGVWPTKSAYLLSPEHAGGGVLMSNGVHDLDLIGCLFGPPAAVDYFADADFGATRRMENDARIEMTTTTGVRGVIELSRTRDLNNGLWIDFDRVRVRVPLYGDEIDISAIDGDSPISVAGSLVDREHREGQDMINMLTLQLEDFAGAVRGKHPPQVGGREGRRTIETIVACYSKVRPLDLPWRAPVFVPAAA